jgi:hypothetical protein
MEFRMERALGGAIDAVDITVRVGGRTIAGAKRRPEIFDELMEDVREAVRLSLNIPPPGEDDEAGYGAGV